MALLLGRQNTLLAEGISSIAPSTSDEAALFIGAGNTGSAGGDYGLFGWKDSNSKLFFNIQNTCEKVYFGFSIPKTTRSYSEINPSTGNIGYAEHLIFRIIDPNGQPINDLSCFGNETIDGEVWQTLKLNEANLTSRAEADLGPAQLNAGGFDAFELDLSGCGLTLTGNYSIEFFTTNSFYDPNRSTSGFHIELFDITVANCNNQGQTGRVWSNNWSLSIKLDGDGAFDRAFNGSFFVCSKEGFIAKIDFNSLTNNRAKASKNTDQLSGFRAGSFNVSFNTTGTANTGNILTDRLSLPNINSPNPLLPVFLNLPDESICPEQPIGQFRQRERFLTGCGNSRCINLATTQLGQLEVLLERRNGNGIFDQPDEVRIAYEITEADRVANPETEDFVYEVCLPWDGRDALGIMWDVNDLTISGFFRQGVYHFPAYDAEFNDDGFLVKTVRPDLGPQEIYYDDTRITELSNTNEPKDGSNGCPAPCHRWTGEWEDITDKDDVYGNFNTINTYWFGRTEFKEFQVIENAQLTVTCPPDFTACIGDNITPDVAGEPVELLTGSDCLSVGFNDATSTTTDCEGGQTIERTWQAFIIGQESQTVECVQRIKIQSAAPPQFSSAPADLTINCNEAAPSSANLTAISSCEQKAVEVNFSQEVQRGNCNNNSVIIRTWTATDACGNVNRTQQTISVIDAEGPIFNTILPDLRLDCDAATPDAASLNVTDNCDLAENISITFTDQAGSSTGDCAGAATLIRTYTATDRCGNATTAQQKIIFEDSTPPVFDNIPADQTVSCDALPAAPTNITASDNCDASSNLAIEFAEERTLGTCGGSEQILRKWTAVDGCGNVATAQQVISLNDETPPTILGVPANLTASCDNIPPATEGVTVADNCGVATLSFAETSVAGSCDGNSGLRRIWTATDECGNTTVSEQLITIVDNTPPQFVDCGQTIRVQAGIDCQAANVPIKPPKATDNCSSSVTITSSHKANAAFPIGQTTVTFTATDACGNQSTCNYLIQVDNAATDDCPEDIEVACNGKIDGAIVSWTPPNGNDCCSSCPKSTNLIGYTYLGYRGGHRYYLSNEKTTWETADERAEATGGSLAIINDPAENQFLTDLLPKNGSAFIGLSDEGSEGDFYWLDGTPLAFTNWLVNQPNNLKNNQHFGQLLKSGKWNDAYPTSEFPYLVEITCVDVQQVNGPMNGGKFEAGTTTVSYRLEYDNCNNVDVCDFDVTVQKCPLRYCNSYALDANCFWIERVALANLDHTSGNDGGYKDFTQFTVDLTPGKTETMLMKPAFNQGHLYDLHWTVFIDYNQDGDFEDTGEHVLSKFERRIFHRLGDKPVFEDFTVPLDATPGLTRMRVAMKFTDKVDPCERVIFGEIQDYTVNILPVSSSFTTSTESAKIGIPQGTILSEEVFFEKYDNQLSNTVFDGKFHIFPNPTRSNLTIKFSPNDDIDNSDLTNFEPTQLQIFSMDGRLMHSEVISTEHHLNIEVQSWTQGLYFLKIMSNDGQQFVRKFTKL
ncbi:MAG: GEVED domain-containing protein [Bacteroidota bacterium]